MKVKIRMIIPRLAFFLCFSCGWFCWVFLSQRERGERDWSSSRKLFGLRTGWHWPGCDRPWCVSGGWRHVLDGCSWLGILPDKYGFGDVCPRICWEWDREHNRVWVPRCWGGRSGAFCWVRQRLRTIFWGLFLRVWVVLWLLFWSVRGGDVLSRPHVCSWGRTYRPIAVRGRFFPFRRVFGVCWMSKSLTKRGGTVAVVFSHRFNNNILINIYHIVKLK